jgi:hypothetical protein
VRAEPGRALEEGIAQEGSAAEPTGETGEGETGQGEAGQGKDVQGLFARLRENRDQATRAARKTLRDTGDEKPADAGPDQTGPEQNGLEQNGPAQDNGHEPVPSRLEAEEAGTAVGPEAESGTNTEGTAATVEAVAGVPGAAIAEAGVDGGAKLLERGDEVTRDIGSSLARKLKRALQDEQNSLLDRLRSLKGPATPAKLLPDPEEHPDHFAEAGRHLLQQAAQAGAQAAHDLCGGKGVAVKVGAEQVDDLAEELGRAIAEPLRQRLELAMRSAGDDPGELADALGAAYREWKTQRIEASAHHEVAAAFSRGTYLTFPEGALLRWVVGSSEGPCPDCEDNALAGDQPKGEAWPTGQMYPPAHPGCRCAVVPADLDGNGAVTVPPNS